jgi:hypothetical protein
VLQVGSVQAGKRLGEIGVTDAAGVGNYEQAPRRLKARIPYHQGMRQHLTGALRLLRFFLRVAASSNPSIERTCQGPLISNVRAPNLNLI